MTSEEQVPRRRGTVAKTLLTIAFLAAGVAYVARHATEFSTLDWPSGFAVTVVVVGFLVSVFFRALYNYLASRLLGADISLLESWMLSAIVTASNVLLPANPGATFRAVYMKRVHAFPYTYFASSAILFVVVTALSMSLIGAFLVALISSRLGYLRLDLLLLLIAIAVVTAIGLALRQRSPGRDHNTVWSSFKGAYLELLRDRRLVYASILIVVSNFVVASFVWVVALRDTAPELATLEAFLFAASQIASGLINLTPGAAGFQELVGVYVGRSFAITTVELFAVLIWVRLVRTFAAVLLAIPCAIVLRARAA